MIVREAIKFFAETGFEGQTRELAKRLGVTQPLLFHYFPTKEALIDRVYQEVYMNHWGPNWEALLKDRSIPLRNRLIDFYKDYVRVIDNPEWVRIFLFSALKHFDIVQRYMALVRERIFKRVCTESRIHFGLPDPGELPISEIEIELVWALHAGIFYISIRKWVYGLATPKDVDALIEVLVDSFLGEFRAAAERSICWPRFAATGPAGEPLEPRPRQGFFHKI